MKNKFLLAVNAVIIAAIFVLNYFYQSNNFDFTLKCICSAGFALLGIINLCCALATKQANTRFYVAMALGLLLSMLGDVLINFNFIAGAATFALGHISFIIAYCFLQKMQKLDLVISGILFVGSGAFLMFFPLLNFEVSIFRIVCIVYALIISLMLGKAVGNLIRVKNTVTVIIAMASVLFFISDLMLVFDRFVGLWSWTNEACMGTYYPALCLLAFSMYQKQTYKK